MGGATRFLMLLTTPLPLLTPRPSLLRLARHSRFLSPLSPFHLTLSPSPHHHHPFKYFHAQSTNTLRDDSNFSDQSGSTILGTVNSQPWPQWSNLIEKLKRNGYFEVTDNIDDEFINVGCLSSEFVTVARVCLYFARDKDNLLGVLSRRDIEVVVENGSAFLFRDADGMKRRMKLFLGTGESDVLESHKASMVDLMKFLLCYANNPPATAAWNYQCNEDVVELAVRNLLAELVNVCFGAHESGFSGSMQKQSPDRHSQAPRAFGQNTEMKRGDWICPKCRFMNFARNVKCLECEESRPRRQLTGGEWECPQCDFFNYGKNVVCLRCDCKRPGEVSFNSTNGSHVHKIDINSRLAANEEKAQRWFSKVSQLDNASDMNNAIADEDFPEIMPLRKGVNRFVVSTRKTPLERRLANAQYRKNLGNDGVGEGNDPQTDGTDNNINTNVSRTLDKILGRNSVVSGTDNKGTTSGQNAGTMTPSPVASSATSPRGSNSNYVPFVPLPADMFAKQPEDLKTGENKGVGDNYESVTSKNKSTGPRFESNESFKSSENLHLSEKPVSLTENKDKEKEEAEKSERWFKRVAELNDVTDLASAIPDEDFPDIMPMRKGENRFVVSKKKDRSLTSPMHKRRMAMEQASNTNFVPFVPFPPDYFAKKDKQPEKAEPSQTSESSSSSIIADRLPPQSNQGTPSPGNYAQKMEHQQSSTGSWNSRSSEENMPGGKTSALYGTSNSGSQNQGAVNPQNFSYNTSGSGHSSTERHTGPPVYESPNSGYPIQSSTSTQDNTSNSRRSGYSQIGDSSGSTNLRHGWTGKSLEGSAVKELDPLDMSEEAKAERWFRRAAQIKDISELSQIPDEDFPSIMPMRKGVNRFVISKRKTPLERRLTSPQYRRNLPIVSSDPLKKENESS